MEWLVALSIIVPFLYFSYWIGKLLECLERGGKAPIIKIDNHPLQRELYIERIVDRESRVYIK